MRLWTFAKLTLNALCLLVGGVTPVHSAESVHLIASYYGHGERLAQHTASGEPFNPEALTCAHRTLPFGTKLKVTFGQRSVVVRVNDRGPAAGTGRSLDLSYGAARALGLIPRGAARVDMVIVD